MALWHQRKDHAQSMPAKVAAINRANGSANVPTAGDGTPSSKNVNGRRRKRGQGLLAQGFVCAKANQSRLPRSKRRTIRARSPALKSSTAYSAAASYRGRSF